MNGKITGAIVHGWGKIRTNFSRVVEGFEDFKEEAVSQTTKIQWAWTRREWIRVLHHLSGYREAAQQHLYKLWFYLFWPRRILEAAILVAVYEVGKAAAG